MQIPLTMTTVIGFWNIWFYLRCSWPKRFHQENNCKKCHLGPNKRHQKMHRVLQWMDCKLKEAYIHDTVWDDFFSTWDVQLGLYYRYSFIEDFLWRPRFEDDMSTNERIRMWSVWPWSFLLGSQPIFSSKRLNKPQFIQYYYSLQISISFRSLLVSSQCPQEFYLKFFFSKINFSRSFSILLYLMFKQPVICSG